MVVAGPLSHDAYVLPAQSCQVCCCCCSTPCASLQCCHLSLVSKHRVSEAGWIVEQYASRLRVVAPFHNLLDITPHTSGPPASWLPVIVNYLVQSSATPWAHSPGGDLCCIPELLV